MNDEIYIATMKEQINSGMYDHLFGIVKGKTLNGVDVSAGKRDLVFLDIGANIGLVSIYAVPYCKRIVAVEPSPETFQKLDQNTDHYSIIEPYRVALAPVNGNVDFYVNDLNFTASSTVNTYGTKISVEAYTLGTILDAYKLDHVDVCKIDCEGCEGRSLSGAEIFEASGVIDCYFVENHNCPETSWEHKLGTLAGNLARCGYHKQIINGMALTASRV